MPAVIFARTGSVDDGARGVSAFLASRAHFDDIARSRSVALGMLTNMHNA